MTTLTVPEYFYPFRLNESHDIFLSRETEYYGVVYNETTDPWRIVTAYFDRAPWDR